MTTTHSEGEAKLCIYSGKSFNCFFRLSLLWLLVHQFRFVRAIRNEEKMIKSLYCSFSVLLLIFMVVVVAQNENDSSKVGKVDGSR